MSLTDVVPFARRAAVALACAAGTLSIVGSAGAQCYSSTPGSTSYADAPADGDLGLAPEITTVGVALDAACDYSVNPNIPGSLIEGDGVFEYVDTDGDPGTGSPTFGGADVAIGSIGVTGIDPPPVLGHWDPVANTFSFSGGASLPTAGTGGFSATLDQLGVRTPLTTGVRVASLWVGIYDDYFDFAPSPGLAAIPFPIAFSATPPPPPAPAPTPAAPVTPVATPVVPVAATSVPTPNIAPRTASGCKVPAVKKLRTAVARQALRHAGCRLGVTTRSYSATVPTGRAIATLPKAGTKNWAEPVDLVVSKGRRPKHHHAHAASAADVRAMLDVTARRLDAAARP
jgi:hypothetical protein